MRAVVQRVSEASVLVDGKITGSIGSGVCVLLGVAQGDMAQDARRRRLYVQSRFVGLDGEERLVLRHRLAFLAVPFHQPKSVGRCSERRDQDLDRHGRSSNGYEPDGSRSGLLIMRLSVV